MIYSNKFIPHKLTYFNNYLATAAMVPFLSDFSGSFCYSSIKGAGGGGLHQNSLEIYFIVVSAAFGPLEKYCS